MTTAPTPPEVDPWDADLVRGPLGRGLLGVFNRAGLLAPSDVHTAARLADLGAESDDAVALAAALAVRAPRVGHVSVDLTSARDVVAADLAGDVDLNALPWPEPAAWLEAVAASPLTALGEEPADRPLRLIGTACYLDRFWRDEVAVAADLRARARPATYDVDRGAAAGAAGAGVRAAADAGAGGYLAGADRDQRHAAETAVRMGLVVVAGGPGTGKTSTVARILAALHDEARRRGERPPLVALAAPTGKAAARLEEAVRAEADRLDAPAAVRRQLAETPSSTLHRLLGARPGQARYRHHRGHRLPHDVVVVDEASMVSLGLMARLLAAVRPDARVVLVGDPEQLASVEAGAVLADIVGPAEELWPGPAEQAGAAPQAGRPSAGPHPAGAPPSGAPPGGAPPAGAPPGAAPPAGAPPAGPLAASIAVLRTNHRFGGPLAELAAAVRAGDAGATVGLLAAGTPELTWHPVEGEAVDDGDAAGPLSSTILPWGLRLVDAARARQAATGLAELGRHRVLCAHRRGPAGVETWNARIQGWVLAARPDLGGEGEWYAGRPLLVTANDYALRLFNGDTGLTLPADATTPAWAAFPAGADPGVRQVSPSRLAGVETVYAMTIHKSQGSEFDEVTLLLPGAESRLLSRQLLYTAVTRVKRHLVLVGTEAAVRTAVERPIARASGLAERLWR